MSASCRATLPSRGAEGIVTVIEPVRGWYDLGLVELWEARGLLYFLTWRDVRVRYKQTALGVLWTVLQPLLTVVVFTVLFGRLIGVDAGDQPYALFAFAGLLPWSYFSQGVTRSASSLVTSANLIRKVYFPRLAVPTAAVLAGLVDLVVSCALLVILMAFYPIRLGWSLLALPAAILFCVMTTAAVGIVLSALNARYRDVGLAIPFVVQIWLFATPVIYRSELVTDRLASLGLPGWLFALNPMVGVVDSFRWVLLGTAPSGSAIAVGFAVAGVLLLLGVVYFRRVEATFADVV